jgi:hypothetical protein
MRRCKGVTAIAKGIPRAFAKKRYSEKLSTIAPRRITPTFIPSAGCGTIAAENAKTHKIAKAGLSGRLSVNTTSLGTAARVR